MDSVFSAVEICFMESVRTVKKKKIRNCKLRISFVFFRLIMMDLPDDAPDRYRNCNKAGNGSEQHNCNILKKEPGIQNNLQIILLDPNIGK